LNQSTGYEIKYLCNFICYHLGIPVKDKVASMPICPGQSSAEIGIASILTVGGSTMDKVFVDGAKICPEHFASDTDNNLYVPGLFAGIEYPTLLPLTGIEVVSFIV
jgi:hypothetical protein